MAGLTTRYYSLSGGLNTSYGLGTINSSPRLTESPETYNIEPYKLSGLKSQDGNKQIGQELTAPISLGFEYRKGSYKYLIVTTTDGKVWEFNKPTDEFVEIYQFQTATQRHSAIGFNQGVVISNGVDDLIYYNHGRKDVLSGDVTVADGSTTVTGVGTEFTTALSPGDYVYIGDLGRYKVDTITSDTELDVIPAISTSYDTVYYQFYDANNSVSIYSTVEVPQIGDTLYSIDTNTDPYTITNAGTVVIAFDPEINNMAYRDTNNVLQSARRTVIHTDITITTTPATLTDLKIYLADLAELNATYVNSDDITVNYPIRGLALQAYEGRIWVGANDGNLYYSEVGLIHGWDVKYGAGAIPPFYNDNSNFTALGIYANYLIAHKQDYSYMIAPMGDELEWTVEPYTDHSCDSQQSWISANNSYYIYSRRNGGIYPFMARTAFINHYLGQEISTKVREDFRYIDSGREDEIFPVYHPVKKYLMFYMPMLQGNGSNIAYIFDFISKSWWMRKLPNKQKVTIAFQFDASVYVGVTTKDSDGNTVHKVLKEFTGSTFDGDEIEFCWKSPWFQYGDGTNYLSTREFRCKISEEYTNNFYVRNRRDGYDAYHERNVNNDKDAFQALEWSDDEGLITETVWDDFDWVEVGYLVRRFPIPDQFFTSQQIEFYGKAKNEGLCLLGFELDRVEKEECPW